MAKDFNSNIDMANRISVHYGKRTGVILFSGTLALESALLFSKIKRGDYVLIPNNVCYRILLAVLRAGAVPILVQPENGISMTANEISIILKKIKVKVLVAVHNMGIPVNIEEIRSICDRETKIIEDASLAWGVEYKGNKIGKYSDFVISSFGKNKPFSFGIGGGVFGNTESILRLIDHKDTISRTRSDILLPYTLPIGLINELENAIDNADQKIQNQRMFAALLSEKLTNTNILCWNSSHGDKPVWHKFPIWTNDNKLFKKLARLTHELGIEYQIQHKYLLAELPILKNRPHIFYDFEKIKIKKLFLSPNQTLIESSAFERFKEI